jgi:hypothetical protein
VGVPLVWLVKRDGSGVEAGALLLVADTDGSCCEGVVDGDAQAASARAMASTHGLAPCRRSTFICRWYAAAQRSVQASERPGDCSPGLAVGSASADRVVARLL